MVASTCSVFNISYTVSQKGPPVLHSNADRHSGPAGAAVGARSCVLRVSSILSCGTVIGREQQKRSDSVASILHVKQLAKCTVLPSSAQR